MLLKRRCLLRGLLAALPLLCVNGAKGQLIQTAVGSPFSLFANRDFSAWTQQGNANWQFINDQAVMNQGGGWLFGRLPLKDFDLDMEYWLDNKTRASFYVRCSDSAYISDETAYKINLGVASIHGYGPGSIVGLSRAQKLVTGERWNSLRVSLRGSFISVWLDGLQVADKVYDTRFASGTVALHVTDGAFSIRKLNVTIPSRW